MRLLLSLSMTMFLVACASTSEILSSWNGHDINEYISKDGPPTSTYLMPDGRTVYTFVLNGGTYATSSYNPLTRSIDTVAEQSGCTINFITKNSIIYSSNWRGNCW